MQSDREQSASDIAQEALVFRLSPKGWHPFLKLARLDRPIGVWLLLLPCWWSLALAGAGPSYWHLYLLFAIGAVVMRGAGCTINDIVDRDFDAKVARTAARPIPAGEITVKQAVIFLAAQLLVGLVILLQFNLFTVVLGVGSLVLVATYPFMKRFTYWPQAFLGLTFNWGALMGWAAVQGDLGWAALFLYLAGLFWTLGYDTIYAHQDKDDDAMIGVKSTALKLGAQTRYWLIGFYGATILMLGQAIDLSVLSSLSYLGLLVAVCHLTSQVYRLDIDDPEKCLALFKSNRDLGMIVFLGLLLGLVH